MTLNLSIKDKARIDGINYGIEKSCTFLYEYKSERQSLGEQADLLVKVYLCPCGLLSTTYVKDRSGRSLDHEEVDSNRCGF